MSLKLPEPMERAFAAAQEAFDASEVPVGCVITDKYGKILAETSNRTLRDQDPTAHAEMLAIRASAKAVGSERLVDCDLYVTLEPCAMCAAAISFARVRRVYFAAADEKMGAVENGPRFFGQATCHHRPEVYGGIGEGRAVEMMRGFFEGRR
jgi:tRNA(adenine34) deaminase